MATLPSLLADPRQGMRAALTRIEAGFDSSSLAAGSPRWQRIFRALRLLAGVSLGVQRITDEVIAGWLHRANLPTRQDVEDVTQALRRIEVKLDRLLAEADARAASRPPRARRPRAPEPELRRERRAKTGR